MPASATPATRAPRLEPLALERARRRSRWTLTAGVAVGSTGHIAAVTVATIVAADLLGEQALAGLPGATVVLGAAIGATTLSAIMAKTTRRRGITLGYTMGVAGAFIATLAVILRSFPLLLVGTLLIGFGSASNQLARYAAADMVPMHRRASAIGTVVWGGTVGSVVGPTIVPVASLMASSVGLPPLAGPYLVPVLFVGAAALLSFAFLRPDPYELADADDADALVAAHASGDAIAPVMAILRRPAVVAALAALVVSQLVMTLIMTMTPLHMTSHHHDLAEVGIVLSGHTLGMYAFSPVSGWLTDRFGHTRTVFLGAAVLAISAVMAAVAPPDGGNVLLVAMFLLGLGWSFGYVAGSAMLSDELEVHERTRIQGVADSLIWSVAAGASLGSGLIVAVAGYTALGILAVGLIAIAAAIFRHNARVAAAAR
jgi:MFS family permease